MFRAGLFAVLLFVVGCVHRVPADAEQSWTQLAWLSVLGLEALVPPAQVDWRFTPEGNAAVRMDAAEQHCTLTGLWSGSAFEVRGVRDCRVRAGGGILSSVLAVATGEGNLLLVEKRWTGAITCGVDLESSEIPMAARPVLPSPLKFTLSFTPPSR